MFALLDRAYIGGGGSSPGSDSGGELGESEGENGGKMGLLGRLFRALMEDENSGILVSFVPESTELYREEAEGNSLFRRISGPMGSCQVSFCGTSRRIHLIWWI